MPTLMHNRTPQVTTKIRMQPGIAKLTTMLPVVRLLAAEFSSSLFKGGPAVCQFQNRTLQFKLNLNKLPKVPMWFRESGLKVQELE